MSNLIYKLSAQNILQQKHVQEISEACWRYNIGAGPKASKKDALLDMFFENSEGLVGGLLALVTVTTN